MSRNGSGTYTLPAGNPVVTGTVIATTWANNTMNDLASAMTDSVAADGQTAMTGNLNLNSNKIVNLATPTLSTDAVTKAYVDTADALSLLKASNLSDVANATTSRTNLVAAKSGANSDITSLTGLTTPLTVAQGGTGAATLTANNVLLGNGTSALQVVAPSTAGNILTSNGTTWVSSTPVVASSSQVAKAWANWDGSTGTIRSSYNVSSVTRVSTGVYTVNITNALANANYAVICGTSAADSNNDGGYMGIKNGTNPTTTSFQLVTDGRTTGEYDPTYAMVTVFST